MNSVGNALALVAAICFVLASVGYLMDKGAIPSPAQIEPVGKIESIHPIQDLNYGWWLVEVRQEIEIENPLPIGPATFKAKVPHLLRLKTNEVQILRNAAHGS